ncbi:MAG: hypothetical protein PHV33_03090 [Elusimicrobiales bacterium]|nr:hypothetical protein [Elusimicrobiales bacterium]
MRRSDEAALVYSMAAYFGASLLATALLLLTSLAAMKGAFAFARLLLGPKQVYWLKPLIFDSTGFALSAAGTALVQYYLASLLRLTGEERPFLGVLVAFCALFCGLLFWRGALQSSLGAYGFSGLCVTLSALLGGLTALWQPPSENPWPVSVSRYFR